MSQVLEKPILLDETGQAIAGKLDTNSAAIIEALDDIKDAIGTSSEFIPVKIQVVTPLTKTIYKVGEHLDLSGMVVNLVGANGVQIDVTSACTFSPANGTALTTSDTAVTVTYLYQHEGTTFTTSQALTIRELSSIAVTTPPINTDYSVGDALDLTGIVVTATYSDGYTEIVTDSCTYNPADGTTLTSSDSSITITLTEGGVTKTTTQAITVKELSSITITSAPTKTSYRADETLDLTGMVVTATYGDGTTVDVTNRCTFNPANGATLTSANTSVTVTYTEGETTKTATQVISVSELQSIAATTPPTTTNYMVGDTLDLTGIVITATYTDNTTSVVTSSCTFSPVDGATLTASDTSVTISYTEAGITKTASQQINVAAIYGVHWDATSSSAFSRTDAAANFVEPNPYYSGMATTPSSPFDNIAPWSGMQIVEDDEAGTLVSIPKFYYKLTQDDSFNYDLKIQISSAPVEGFSVSPAHMDRGDGEGERDVIYVGRYHSDKMNDFKSTTGVNPSGYSNFGDISNSRIKIHQLGSDIWQWDFATYFTIWLLYLVEFADWNCQAKIGYGEGTGSYSNTGYTDSMPYHTGTTMTNKTTYGIGTQYRHIEGLWDNVYDWLDGCFADSGNFKVILKPSDFSDTSKGVSAGSPISGDYIKKMVVQSPSGLFPLFYPVDVYSGGDSDGTTYCCDRSWYTTNNNAPYFIVGGYSTEYNSLKTGLFALWNQTGVRSMEKGARLMKLPANS